MFCHNIFDQLVGFYENNYFSQPHGLLVNNPFSLQPHELLTHMPIRAQGIIVKYTADTQWTLNWSTLDQHFQDHNIMNKGVDHYVIIGQRSNIKKLSVIC